MFHGPVRWLGALAPDQQKQVDQAIAYVPSCYSKEFDDCISGRSSSFPNCAELNAIYNKNNPDVYAAIEAYVDALPFCQAPAPPAKLSTPVAVGLGFLAAMLVGIVINA